jgi:tRNA(Ile)-lysidine synthase
VHSLAQRVLAHIRRQELLKAGDRVGAAVSGGIDSVALLRLLLELRGELGIVLSVVHFNHKLRGAESDADEQCVSNLAREHDLEFFSDSDDVAQQAAEEHISVEVAARDVRYGFFRSLLGEDGSAQGLKPNSFDPAEHGPEETVSQLSGTRKSGTLRANQPRSGDRMQPTAQAVGQKVGDQQAPKGRKKGCDTVSEAPLFHGASGGASESRALSNQSYASLDKIATAHTLDDQAETVLMHMIRGTGMRGLGGIHPRLLVEGDDGEACGEIVRPFLEFRRRELEQYLREIGQGWREDSSNDEIKFTRNRVRKLLVPLLEKEFNPSIRENLAELAEIARGEEDYWENEVAGWMGTAVHWSEPAWARGSREQAGLIQISAGPHPPAKNAGRMGQPGELDLHSRIDAAPWLVANASVDRVWFLGEPVAVQRRLVKAVGERAGIPLEFKHVEEILAFAAKAEQTKELSLPKGWTVRCQPHELLFLTPDLRDPATRQNYEYPLAIPGHVEIREAGLTVEVQIIPARDVHSHNSDVLLDADALPGPLRIRNWRAGDRFRPAHTKSAKKIKELLQEHRVPAQARKLWPVVISGDEIVWVRDFAASAKHRPRPGQAAILITAVAAGSDPAVPSAFGPAVQNAVSLEEKLTTRPADK